MHKHTHICLMLTFGPDGQLDLAWVRAAVEHDALAAIGDDDARATDLDALIYR